MRTDMISVQTRHSPLFYAGRDLIEQFKVKMRIPASFTYTAHLFVRADSPLTPAAAAMVAAIKAEVRELAFAGK